MLFLFELAEENRSRSIVTVPILAYEDHVALIQVDHKLDFATDLKGADGDAKLGHFGLGACADLTTFVEEDRIDHLDVLGARKNAGEHEADTVSDGELALGEAHGVREDTAAVNVTFGQDGEATLVLGFDELGAILGNLSGVDGAVVPAVNLQRNRGRGSAAGVVVEVVVGGVRALERTGGERGAGQLETGRALGGGAGHRGGRFDTILLLMFAGRLGHVLVGAGAERVHEMVEKLLIMGCGVVLRGVLLMVMGSSSSSSSSSLGRDLIAGIVIRLVLGRGRGGGCGGLSGSSGVELVGSGKIGKRSIHAGVRVLTLGDSGSAEKILVMR